ncbi:hypothetical protein [Pontibacter arcticus]|uniref:Uncharacterized protein n=1 Tax=Pontibacter arcticus TaxID=2080288 RepID=A0A364RC11_9BACT|nr:hypothetical protein [Pontibacter arcticus]RAU81880.1 hypothetical protein DP923_14415 [Pontibacter arcticus]
MEIENLIVQLKPSYTATARNRGYNLDEEESNDYDIMFSQGFNIDEIEVEPGEEFTISRDFESGSINCEETKYTYVKKRYEDDEEEWDDDRSDEDWIVLGPGRYKFENDGNTIIQLSINNNFD